MKKIAILTPYPHNSAPSQRFRHEQYLPLVDIKKFRFDYYSFFNQKAWDRLYSNGNIINKILSVVVGFIKRFSFLTYAFRYDYIYIHREATPVGPPIIEFILYKIFRARVIYDFDDAIFLEDDNSRSSIMKFLKNSNKVKSICRWSYKVSVGNNYLNDWAIQYNENTVIIPTVVDTENYHNPALFTEKKLEKLVIGWTGSHSTLTYLDSIYPIITKLQMEFDFTFLVIANVDPKPKLKDYLFIEWNEESEIRDIMKMDIGIMPLENTKWAKGKCGFKAIQYMALKIPAVVSDVGVNSSIVDDKKNGLIIRDFKDWEPCLKNLLLNKERRINFGKNARLKINNSYSTKANYDKFINLFT